MASPHQSLRILVLLVSFILLSACTTGLVNPQIPPPGSPPYQEGYVNGCMSGFSDAGRDGYEPDYFRDDKRYASEGDYRRGWDEGHVACYEEERRHPKMLPGAI